MFCALYVSMVHPHLEYASQNWNPHLIRDIQVLEKVQRHTTKLVPELQHLSYDDRLSVLNPPSLLYRRRRIDMITVFKLFTDWREYHLKYYSVFTTQLLGVMGTNYIRN